jgi:Na+-transporting NADH:ubiquinone oxidoreductase subunit D
VVGFFRELFGSGTIWGYTVVPESWYIENGGFYANNGMMILPPMALITIAIIIWVQRSRDHSLIEENN